MSALNPEGAKVSELLPLNYAEEALAAEAAKARSARPVVALVQVEGESPYQSYTPQSSVIFGILKQMKEDFETKLSKIQGEESKNAEDYEALVGAKTKELDALKKKLDAMQEEYFANKKGLIDAKEDLELTRDLLKKDKEFLQNLRLTCQDLDHQWELRSKTRTEELKAVSETIAIITEDDARETMARAIPKFLQTQATAGMALRAKAAAVLRRAAQDTDFDADDLLASWRGRSGTPQRPHTAAAPRTMLSTLALTVQLDAFTKVKAAMDTMVAELKAEQREEVESKAFCDKEFNENAKMTYKKEEEKADLEA